MDDRAFAIRYLATAFAMDAGADTADRLAALFALTRPILERGIDPVRGALPDGTLFDIRFDAHAAVLAAGRRVS